jgi:hypothetical protein
MANMLKLALGGFTEWQGTHDGAGKVVLYDENGNPVEVATEATLAALQSELALVKGELAAIKANQVSGDQKVQLKGSNLALRQTIVTGAKTVVSTAAEIFAGASRLDNRHAMVVTNTGADIVYIGAVGVTTSNGFPLVPQDTLRIEFDPTSSVGVFACTSGPNVQVRVVELA